MIVERHQADQTRFPFHKVMLTTHNHFLVLHMVQNGLQGYLLWILPGTEVNLMSSGSVDPPSYHLALCHHLPHVIQEWALSLFIFLLLPAYIAFPTLHYIQLLLSFGSVIPHLHAH